MIKYKGSYDSLLNKHTIQKLSFDQRSPIKIYLVKVSVI